MQTESVLIAKIEGVGVTVQRRGAGWCLHRGQRTMLVAGLDAVTRDDLQYLGGLSNRPVTNEAAQMMGVQVGGRGRSKL